MSEPIILTPFINGEFVESAAVKYTDVFDPSTGEIIAKAPQCTAFEIEKAVAAAKAAYGPWKNIPAHKRAQYFFRLRELLREHLEELTGIVARENGKVWSEAEGDVLKAIEMTEIATSIPALLMKPDGHSGYDTTVPGAPWRVCRNRPLELPGHDPHGLDGPHRHRLRQYLCVEGRVHDPHDGSADRRIIQGGRFSRWGHQCGDLFQK